MDRFLAVNGSHVSRFEESMPKKSHENEWQYKLRIARISISKTQLSIIYDEDFEKYYIMLRMFLQAEFLKKFADRRPTTRLFAVFLLTGSNKSRYFAIQYLSRMKHDFILEHIETWKNELLQTESDYRALGYLLYDNIEIYDSLPKFQSIHVMHTIGGILSKLSYYENSPITSNCYYLLHNFLNSNPGRENYIVEYIVQQNIYQGTASIKLIRNVLLNFSSVDQISLDRKMIQRCFTIEDSNMRKKLLMLFIEDFGYTCQEIFSMLTRDISDNVLLNAATTILEICERRLDRNTTLNHIKTLNNSAMLEWYNFFLSS